VRIGSRDDTRWRGILRPRPVSAAIVAAGVVLGVGLTGPALARPDEGAGSGTGAVKVKAKPTASASAAKKDTTGGKSATKTEPAEGKRSGTATKKAKPSESAKANAKTKASASTGSKAVKGWAKVIADPTRKQTGDRTRAEPSASTSPAASRVARPTIEATPDPDSSSPAATEPVITGIVEGDGQLAVTWTAPDSGTVTSYTVWVGGDVPDPDCDEIASDTLTCTVNTGLENETSYAVEVAANHGSGEPSISQPWWATPKASVVAPGAPTLADIDVEGNELVLSWTAPENDGGGAILGYRITATHPKEGGGTEDVACVQPAGRTDTTCTITGVSGVEYTASVAAWNSHGAGPASAEKTATAASSEPGAPTVKAELSGSTVTVTATSSDTGGVDLDGYEITVTTVGDGAAVACAGTKTSQPPVVYPGGTCTFEGVQGESYTVKARAHNSVGWSTMTTVTRMMPPAAPTASIAVEGRTVTVSWTPHGTGGAPIQGYQVTVHREGQQDAVPCTGQMGSGDSSTLYTGSSCTFTGVPGAEYSVSVKARNSVGTSAIAGTDSEAVQALAGPSGLKVTPDDGTATVTWTPITPATGITGYVVTYTKEDGQPQTAQVQGAGTGTHTLTGLENGATYAVKVKAALSDGTASDTEAVKVTPSAPPAIPQDGPPESDGTLSAPAGSTTPDPGETITISGTGFAPNSEVTIVIYSSPHSLGTVMTDQAGAFSKAVTIPSNLSGSHTITSMGIDPDGASRVLALGVTIAGSTTTGGGGGSGGGSGGLAITGAPIVTILLTGILLLASGFATRFAGRTGVRRGIHRR
jgi:titin